MTLDDIANNVQGIVQSDGFHSATSWISQRLNDLGQWVMSLGPFWTGVIAIGSGFLIARLIFSKSWNTSILMVTLFLSFLIFLILAR